MRKRRNFTILAIFSRTELPRGSLRGNAEAWVEVCNEFVSIGPRVMGDFAQRWGWGFCSRFLGRLKFILRAVVAANERQRLFVDKVVFARFQHFHDRPAVESSRGEKARLFRAFGRSDRQFAEFLAPHLAGTGELGFVQFSAGILNQRFVDAVALQLVHDPACAKTSTPSMNNALHKSLIR